jgi:hypothetical protein
MNFYKNNLSLFNQEEPEKNAPEISMEKMMMGAMMFDKKFIEQRKVFFVGRSK